MKESLSDAGAVSACSHPLDLVNINLQRALAIAACAISALTLGACGDSRVSDSTTQYYGPVPLGPEDPYFTFCFRNDTFAWALFLEGGYLLEGSSAEIYPEESGSSKWSLRLKGLGGNDNMDVPVATGDMLLVTSDGQVKPVPNAFRLPQNHEDLYSGSLDLKRYPELQGVAELFDSWGKRDTDQGGGDQSDSIPAREQFVKLQGDVTFTLADGEILHEDNPETFWIPPKERRENLVEGDLVKLVFSLSDGEQTQRERMWVLVKGGDQSGYTGTLDNDPYSTDRIKAGFEVSFEARHVIDIFEHEEAGGGE